MSEREREREREGSKAKENKKRKEEKCERCDKIVKKGVRLHEVRQERIKGIK